MDNSVEVVKELVLSTELENLKDILRMLRDQINIEILDNRFWEEYAAKYLAWKSNKLRNWKRIIEDFIRLSYKQQIGDETEEGEVMHEIFLDLEDVIEYRAIELMEVGLENNNWRLNKEDLKMIKDMQSRYAK